MTAEIVAPNAASGLKTEEMLASGVTELKLRDDEAT